MLLISHFNYLFIYFSESLIRGAILLEVFVEALELFKEVGFLTI